MMLAAANRNGHGSRIWRCQYKMVFAGLYIAKFGANCLFINLDDGAFWLAAETGGDGILIAAYHRIHQWGHGAFFNGNALDVQNIFIGIFHWKIIVELAGKHARYEMITGKAAGACGRHNFG